jgi:hypothetical protein
MQLFDLARRVCALALLTSLTACISVTPYVDNGMPEVPASQFKKTEPAHPVQVVFEFQTKGVANAKATAAFKQQVTDQVKASGVFSDAAVLPVEGGALLSVVINNVPLTDNAAAKGFGTGLTFGLVGSEVADGYVCTATYSSGQGAAPVVRTERHVIRSTIGNASAPAGATRASSMTEAATLMTHQLLSHVLDGLTHDPAFK